MMRNVASSRARNERLRTQYVAASADYHRISRYLKAASGTLSPAERDLLSQFAELAKRKYGRLRRRITKHVA